MRRLALLVTVACAAAVPAVAHAMSRSDAVALANAVNLVSSDMPGYDESPPSDSGGSDPAFVRCAGSVPARRAIAQIASADFTRNDSVDVSSAVEVLPSAALVRKDVNATLSARGRKCFVKELHGLSARASLLHPAVAHARGVRLTMHLRSGRSQMRMIVDGLVVTDGPVEATLTVLTSPGLPSKSEENRLLGLIATRLHAQLHPSTVL